MNKAKNMISNYESNVQLLNECFSNNSIKVILKSVYEKEIDSDIIDIVFYSTLFNVRLEGFYLNITRSHNYIDLVKEFSKVNIIPIFRDSTYKEKTEPNIDGNLYAVCVGAYKDKNKANSTAEQLKKQGYIISHKQRYKWGYPL